jgi:hypothetical protein
LTKRVHDVGSVAHQPAGRDNITTPGAALEIFQFSKP